MIPSFGNAALLLAAIACFLQLFPLKPRQQTLITCVTAALVCFAFGCLMYSYVVSDFSVLNVYNNSHQAKPLLYKITGTWGNHEGSILLLTMLLCLYNAAFLRDTILNAAYKSTILRLQSAITLGFIAFAYFTSNPFDRISPTPEAGLGLNPLLQDIGLATHPPILYIGYIGLSLGLSHAVAALLYRSADAAWAASVKKWTLFSWSFLTFGIFLGSWWAYRELGWGGFWFWDPVENASLMPWLAATAFLHSLVVTEKRGSLKAWTVLLGILTFSLSLIGIFLVRSGIVTSIHAFATDPTRGTFILFFLGAVISGSLVLFAARAHHLKPENNFAPLSKEGGILINNLLLTVACITVLLGTIYPILLEMFSTHRVSVGAPYFNATFPLLALPLLMLAGVVPALHWTQDGWRRFSPSLVIPLAAALVVGAAVAFVPSTTSPIAIIACATSSWLITSMLYTLAIRLRRAGSMAIPKSFYGMVLSHIGAGILAIGITVVSCWGTEEEKILQIGESITTAGYVINLQDMFITTGDNYLTRMGLYKVTNSGGNLIAILQPEVRYYPIEQSNTTESVIMYRLLSNIYVAMGDSDGNGGYVTRVYYKPLVNLIWFGAFCMGLGGLVALLKRKDTK